MTDPQTASMDLCPELWQRTVDVLQLLATSLFAPEFCHDLRPDWHKSCHIHFLQLDCVLVQQGWHTFKKTHSGALRVQPGFELMSC